jgi:toxin ParE1/3/4
MNGDFEFLPEAFREVEEATFYYQSCDSDLGFRFRQLVENACAAIARSPLHWNERKGGFRRVNLKGFPYDVAYFIRGHRIIIAAVAHASQHPDFWKQRSGSDR